MLAYQMENKGAIIQLQNKNEEVAAVISTVKLEIKKSFQKKQPCR